MDFLSPPLSWGETPKAPRARFARSSSSPLLYRHFSKGSSVLSIRRLRWLQYPSFLGKIPLKLLGPSFLLAISLRAILWVPFARTSKVEANKRKQTSFERNESGGLGEDPPRSTMTLLTGPSLFPPGRKLKRMKFGPPRKKLFLDLALLVTFVYQLIADPRNRPTL
jgi:hypothetical protein